MIGKNSIIVSALLVALCSCGGREEERAVIELPLAGESVDIGEDESLFGICYADDSILLARTLSPSFFLVSYRLDGSRQPYEFVDAGRGPKEILRGAFRCRRDTVFVLSGTGYGINGVLAVPVSSIWEKSRWEYTAFPEQSGVWRGEFDVLDGGSGYVFVGGRHGDRTIISTISRDGSDLESLGYWPGDSYTGSPLPKQNEYAASGILCNGDKLLFASSEGRYASIIDLAAGGKETVLYGDYPEYSAASDGINARRSERSWRGVRAYANGSHIYVLPINAKIKDGNWAPSDYKGYPPDYNDLVDVFDWEGRYECSYRLDVPACDLYVAEDDTVIYALTVDNQSLTSRIRRYFRD